MQIGDSELNWLQHSGFVIKGGGKIIYIDPYKIRDGLSKADIILITHSHYDHCSIEDIRKLIRPGTIIVVPADAQSKITRLPEGVEMQIVEPEQEINLGNLKILTYPAYNIDKPFHPRDENWLSYVLKIGDLVIYHAGDTDIIPEMQKLTGHRNGGRFIALLPVGGRFTMTAEEAAEAARLIKPDVAIPMHYGSIVGDERDAEEFVSLCKENGIHAEILERE